MMKCVLLLAALVACSTAGLPPFPRLGFSDSKPVAASFPDFPAAPAFPSKELPASPFDDLTKPAAPPAPPKVSNDLFKNFPEFPSYKEPTTTTEAPKVKFVFPIKKNVIVPAHTFKDQYPVVKAVAPVAKFGFAVAPAAYAPVAPAYPSPYAAAPAYSSYFYPVSTQYVVKPAAPAPAPKLPFPGAFPAFPDFPKAAPAEEEDEEVEEESPVVEDVFNFNFRPSFNGQDRTGLDLEQPVDNFDFLPAKEPTLPERPVFPDFPSYKEPTTTTTTEAPTTTTEAPMKFPSYADFGKDFVPNPIDFSDFVKPVDNKAFPELSFDLPSYKKPTTTTTTTTMAPTTTSKYFKDFPSYNDFGKDLAQGFPDSGLLLGSNDDLFAGFDSYKKPTTTTTTMAPTTTTTTTTPAPKYPKFADFPSLPEFDNSAIEFPDFEKPEIPASLAF